MITYTEISRVYSGKIGCACGCRGKYYDRHDGRRSTQRMIHRVVDILNQQGAEIQEGIAYAEIEGRAYTAYQPVAVRP